MTAKDLSQQKLNKIKETHFFLRPVLVNALKKQIISEEGGKLLGGANTYYEYWTNSFNDRFYDMSTIIRLGTEIENALKFYYMEKKGFANLVELKKDENYRKNIFQRIFHGRGNNALDIYKFQLNINLEEISNFKKIQELMLCRHLYAHNSGLLDDDFIYRYKELTGLDVSQLPLIKENYPQDDTYYFGPLNGLNKFIEESSKFIGELP